MKWKRENKSAQSRDFSPSRVGATCWPISAWCFCRSYGVSKACQIWYQNTNFFPAGQVGNAFFPLESRRPIQHCFVIYMRRFTGLDFWKDDDVSDGQMIRFSETKRCTNQWIDGWLAAHVLLPRLSTVHAFQRDTRPSRVGRDKPAPAPPPVRSSSHLPPLAGSSVVRPTLRRSVYPSMDESSSTPRCSSWTLCMVRACSNSRLPPQQKQIDTAAASVYRGIAQNCRSVSRTCICLEGGCDSTTVVYDTSEISSRRSRSVVQMIVCGPVGSGQDVVSHRDLGFVGKLLMRSKI